MAWLSSDIINNSLCISTLLLISHPPGEPPCPRWRWRRPRPGSSGGRSSSRRTGRRTCWTRAPAQSSHNIAIIVVGDTDLPNLILGTVSVQPGRLRLETLWGHRGLFRPGLSELVSRSAKYQRHATDGSIIAWLQDLYEWILPCICHLVCRLL